MVQNPFNGIERLAQDPAFVAVAREGIHSMELKGQRLLQRRTRIPCSRPESIQWN